MNAVVPLNQLQRRAPEAGRIRMGVKTGRAMKSIDTFRFTSPHKAAIEQLAELYGGDPAPWSEPKAAPNQWEVITEAKSIEVLAQPGGCTVWYEQWTGGGCARRCDGVTVEVAGRDGMDDIPCICNAKGARECDPYTRLNVVLPNLDFYGVWRLQTKGWNAAKELPGMFDMVVELAESGRMVRAMLNLEQRKSVSNGQTKNFVVPTITVGASPNELLAGGGVARPQLTSSQGHAAPAGELGAGATPAPYTTGEDDAPQVPDAEVVEATVVDVERESLIEEKVRSIAAKHKMDETAVVAAIWTATDGDYDKLERFIAKDAEGKTLSWTQTGTLKWTSSPS